MNPSFLLDSSVCVAILRNQAGLQRLPDPNQTAIPVIVATELWAGVQKNMSTHPQQAARLEAFLSLFVIADFNMDAALQYAEIRAGLEATGQSIGPMDLLIAAQAKSLGATLVTS